MSGLKNISELLKGEKSIKIIIFAGLGVIVAIFISGLYSQKGPDVNVSTDFSSYENELEEKLCRTLSNISGTGEITVMITVEKTEEDILSQKETSVTTTIMPKIRGVVIICDGADNVIVRQKIVESVTRVFDISSTKVAVVS